MTENIIYYGYITWYNTERRFGLVKTITGESFFFFFDKNEFIKRKREEGIRSYHEFRYGDEVEFKIRQSLKDNSKFEAFDLRFIKNERVDKLIEEANVLNSLWGYLQLINDKFFVKHISTYTLIPLEISAWETDLGIIYHNRINKKVNFRLTQTKNTNKLKAVLTDTIFTSDYCNLKSALNSEKILQATITGRNTQGFFATIFDGLIEGFILISKKRDNTKMLKYRHIKKGNIVDVKIKYIQHNNKHVSFTLFENDTM